MDHLHPPNGEGAALFLNNLQSNFFDAPLEGARAEVGARSFVVSCPICTASAEFWCRASDHHYGNSGAWHVYRCSHCRHMFQYPQPEEGELLRFYPDSYYAHQPPVTDFAPRGLHHRGVWLWLHYLKYFRGYQHLGVTRNLILAYLGNFLDQRPLHLIHHFLNG